MPAKLIVRVYPNDRIEVKVEGLTDRDSPRPKREKLCEKVTRRLEQDLGIVTHREYEDDGTVESPIGMEQPDRVELGE
jgi:hypothetical protein